MMHKAKPLNPRSAFEEQTGIPLEGRQTTAAAPACTDEDLRLQVRRLRMDLAQIAQFARNSLDTAHFDMHDWRHDMQQVAEMAQRATTT